MTLRKLYESTNKTFTDYKLCNLIGDQIEWDIELQAYIDDCGIKYDIDQIADAEVVRIEVQFKEIIIEIE